MVEATIYGDGSLYADADFQYGRVGSGLINAQAARVRETALRVQVLDEQLNAWELHAGSHSFPDTGLGVGLYLPLNGTFKPYDLETWGLRGRADFAVKTNGDVIRVRNGDPANGSDRQLWWQTITDPGTPSQWTSWSVLYSGSHYGSNTIQIDDDGTTVLVYHCKSDGLYRNNTKVIDNSEFDLNDEKAIWWIPVEGKPDMGWVMTICKDGYDNRRTNNFYFLADVSVDSPIWDHTLNYDWNAPGLTGIISNDGLTVHGLFNAPIHYNPRDGNNGNELAYFSRLISSGAVSAMMPIRGIGGGAGVNFISGPRVVKLSDGYYYFTGFEWHRPSSASFSAATSLGYGFPIWARSKDLIHWTDPTVGPPMKNSWGFIGGMLEVDGYVYMADSEEVWRRPIGTITTEVSNYVPEVSFEIPRDNQPATGSLVIANPNGINDAIKALSGREIVIEPGLKVESGIYEYAKFDRFFIGQVNRDIQGGANRLQMSFGNIWTRLDNPMRDITNFVGKFIWDDFSADKRNQAFNYFFVSDSAPTVTNELKLSTRGIVLLTAWKGNNPDIQVQFSNVTGTPRVIVRYVDASNYMYAQVSGTVVSLHEVVAGVTRDLDTSGSITADSSPRIRVRLRWGKYDVWVNDVLILDSFNEPIGPSRKPGYVGFSATSYRISNLHVEDWEADLTMADLIKTALAMGDFHDALVGGADSRAVAIVWGPQTDVDTPAAALAQILETEKLQIAWRNGSLEVGRFSEQSPVRTIQDTVIESSEIDEAARRPNLVAIDGNEHYWLEVDTEDAKSRGHMVTSYFDLPELLDQSSVTARAQEEMKRAAQGTSPGGKTPLYFDLWRMDPVTWVDNAGNSQVVRIEGFSVEINQSTMPSQRQTFDTSLFSEGSASSLMDDGTVDE